MATYKIPNQQGNIVQLNISDTSGDIWSSFNIDLQDTPGKIKLARPTKQIADDTDIDDRVTAFTILDDDIYASSENALFSTSATDITNWQTRTTTPSGVEDMVVFKDQVILTTTDDLDAFDGVSTYTQDWWTARGNPSLSNSFAKILHITRVGAEKLIVGNGSEAYSYDGGITSGAILSTTLDLDTKFTITAINSGIRSTWLGTTTDVAKEAFVYEWDNTSTNYTQAYPVGDRAVLAMDIYKDAPVIITERGYIKMFNNAGFEIIGQFPFATKPLFDSSTLSGGFVGTPWFRPIHHKGTSIVGDLMYIYCNWENSDNSDTPMDEQTPNGLWVFNFKTGSLNHIGSAYNDYIQISSSPLLTLNSNQARYIFGSEKREQADSFGIHAEDLSVESTNTGYLVTSELNTNSVTDTFDEVVIKALLGSEDAILVKYRTTGDVSLPVIAEDVVWLDETTFNTTADLSYIKTRFDSSVDNRDEVEVILGQSAGKLAHITNITKSELIYSVTIDEELGQAGELSDVRIDNWKLIPRSMTLTDGEYYRFGLVEVGAWCQFKIALSGKAGYPEIREVIINTTNKSSK